MQTEISNGKYEKYWKTNIAMASNEKTYRGTLEVKGIKIWKLKPNEYNVGATFPTTDKATKTVKNFPNPPTG